MFKKDAPLWVDIPLIIAGALMGALAGVLPQEVQVWGFSIGVGLGVFGVIGMAWHFFGFPIAGRVPIHSIRKPARDLGWELFEGIDVLDFIAALKQAGADGRLKFFGRKDAHAPLTEIPKEHWGDFSIELMAFRGFDNTETETRSLLHRVGYKDIHVLNDALKGWIKTDASQFRGFTKIYVPPIMPAVSPSGETGA